jgi:hypothetical protein
VNRPEPRGSAPVVKKIIFVYNNININRMKNKYSLFQSLLLTGAVAGNLVFILWILYNGINENFQGTLLEKISYITLMALLAVNSILLLRSRRRLA